MDTAFSLVEKLVALAHPTIVGLHSLLGVTLSPVNNANQYWSFYEAHPSSGLVARVDFREPVRGASKYEPLLVVTLRDAPVRLQDLSHKYDQGRISDLSHHHPGFVGYTHVVHGRDVSFKIDSKSERESWHFQSTTQQLHTAVRSEDHDARTKNFRSFYRFL